MNAHFTADNVTVHPIQVYLDLKCMRGSPVLWMKPRLLPRGYSSFFPHTGTVNMSWCQAGFADEYELYHRSCLSFRDVEDLLAERGVVVTYETMHRDAIRSVHGAILNLFRFARHMMRAEN